MGAHVLNMNTPPPGESRYTHTHRARVTVTGMAGHKSTRAILTKMIMYALFTCFITLVSPADSHLCQGVVTRNYCSYGCCGTNCCGVSYDALKAYSGPIIGSVAGLVVVVSLIGCLVCWCRCIKDRSGIDVLGTGAPTAVTSHYNTLTSLVDVANISTPPTEIAYPPQTYEAYQYPEEGPSQSQGPPTYNHIFPPNYNHLAPPDYSIVIKSENGFKV